MLTPNLLFLQVFAILLATQERPSAFKADPGGELAKLLVPVGEHGMNETDTDGVYFTEGTCCGSWVGSLQVHQLGEADRANLAEWEAVYRELWGSRGWFLTEETAPAADADSSNQDGDGGGLPSGDGAGPGHSGGDGGHSGGDAGAEAMAVAEAQAPGDASTPEITATDVRGGGNGDGGGLPGGDSGGDVGAEHFSESKQDLFVQMLLDGGTHYGGTHAFSVSFSDTTVEELTRLVKQRLESKQMSLTAVDTFFFQGASYNPRIDGHRILSELGMAKNSTIIARISDPAVDAKAEAPADAMKGADPVKFEKSEAFLYDESEAEAPAVDKRTGLPRQFFTVLIHSGPSVGKVLEFSVCLDNTTVGGLAHLVKQEIQKSPSHGGETTVKSFQFEEKTFDPGSHQGSVTLAVSGCHRDATMVAFLYDERVGFGHTSLSVHLITLNGYTEHTIFFSPTISSFCDVVMRLSYIWEHAVPGLATVLRGFNESGYELELDGKEVSRSSWGVVGFDGFELGKAPSRSALHVKVLQGDGGPILSPAAQPEPDMRMTSELFVKFEEKVIRLHVCASHDTISDLFGMVFEKLDYLPSPSRIFYLRIGLRFWKQMGGKSLKQGEYWKQEDAGNMTTTLSEAGCHGQEGLTLQAHEVSVPLIPLSIKVPGDSLLVDVNLEHTSLVGLAGLVQEQVGEPVVHFIFGTENLDPFSEKLRDRRLCSFNIKKDSTLAVQLLLDTEEEEAAAVAGSDDAAAEEEEAAVVAALDDVAAAKDGELPGLDDAEPAKERELLGDVAAAEASHEKNADAAAAAAAAASDAAATASTPATSVSLIPLWGPEKYGVWQGRVVDGVAELREYLLANWSPSGCKLPMHGCSPIYSYVGFPLTAALYDRDLQMQNTLRWSHCVTRADHLRQYLPGYQQIEQAVMRLLLAVFPRWLVLGLGLHNGHMLRQFFAADGGSGFSGHIDEADGASKTLLYLSVIVKLTADPVGAHGTWMQVDGYPPVRYGSVDGAVVIFLSRSKHSSLRTPHNMGKVLKLALFYKFTDPQLIAQYQEVAPPALARGTPLEFSILPSQVPKDPHTPYNLIPSHLTCFVLTSSHLAPSHLIPSHLAPADFNGMGCRIGCKIHATCKCNDE